MIESAGMDWREKGYANCKITSPLYDGENFEVISEIPREGQTNTFLKNEDGKIIAKAESKILENISSKPKYRGDPLIQEDFKPPVKFR